MLRVENGIKHYDLLVLAFVCEPPDEELPTAPLLRITSLALTPPPPAGALRARRCSSR